MNSYAENVVIRNNICSRNLSFQIALEGISIDNVTVDHNLIDCYRGYWGEIYGSDSVIGDPRFVNPSGADFHLQKDSPAIDKGSSIDAPNDDFYGNSRPQGAGYDIGDYEYGNSANNTYYAEASIRDINVIDMQTIVNIILGRYPFGGVTTFETLHPQAKWKNRL